jgi:GPH family glycoside/pentoside/hexuronide:cation symporter
MSLGAVFQILGAGSLGLFGQRFDKRTLAGWLSIITGLAYGACYFVPTDSFALLVVLNCVATFTMGPTSALVWAMYGDVADYGEWKFGRRSTGLIYSASLFALKTGSMIAGFIGPMILHLTGFVPNIEQTPRTILGLMIAFCLLPMAFAILKGMALWFYPLKQHELDRIEEELAARRAGEDTDTAVHA